jgi:hypothetical protein
MTFKNFIKINCYRTPTNNFITKLKTNQEFEEEKYTMHFTAFPEIQLEI